MADPGRVPLRLPSYPGTAFQYSYIGTLTRAFELGSVTTVCIPELFP